jgi:hypothetical protein
MTCPKCGREYQGQTCTFCATLLTAELPSEKPQECRSTLSPKSIGVCPDCGTEQLGTIYKLSGAVAAFLKLKEEDTFIPDRHRCARKAVAG